VQRARDGGGPQFLEALTYRFVGHSRSDPGAYRKPGELDAWRERDPLKLAREELERLGAEPRSIEEIDGGIEADVEQLTHAALAAPFPQSGPVREFKE
jgi:TPP-dependent pyruvate/acetoin dehydrogenase alpha subunit